MQARETLMPFGILVLVILVATAVRSQAPTEKPWEYASVTRAFTSGPSGTDRFAAARICYGTPQGCRYEDVNVNWTSAIQPSDYLLAAAAKLGAQGWEFVSATESSPTSSIDSTVLYFRRQKAK